MKYHMDDRELVRDVFVPRRSDMSYQRYADIIIDISLGILTRHISMQI